MRITSPLQTPRLILKTLDPNELSSDYVTWLNDKEINQFLELRFYKHSAKSVRKFVADMNDSPDNLLLGIFLKKGQVHIGNIKIGPVVEEHSRADIGLLIGDRNNWGRGYATEAIGAVTDYALGILRLHRVTAGCYEDNIGSHMAFLKNGYVEDGRLKNYFRRNDKWQDHIILYKLGDSTDGEVCK